MILQKLTRAAAVVAALAAVGAGVSFAAPQSASAAAQTSRSAMATWGGATVEAQADNNPGSGAASWIWGADYRSGDSEGALVHVDYVDGSSESRGPIFNGSSSANLSKDIRRFQVCFYTTSGLYYHNCSAWTYM
ncbi:hypothetical protein OG206_00870 [Streptomyces sp. NBC_01341]|uniref:hypothetical protein n=1 Tax=Streptomyces sp. NBC_01341 TaxID=2903831 RepID=UPI002E14EEE2|nr:hypothetical protein OG206_00870 [Streptomyces sp. NBC_01341]